MSTEKQLAGIEKVLAATKITAEMEKCYFMIVLTDDNGQVRTESNMKALEALGAVTFAVEVVRSGLMSGSRRPEAPAKP